MIDIVDFLADFDELARKYGLEKYFELNEYNQLDGAVLYNTKGSKVFSKINIKELEKLSEL